MNIQEFSAEDNIDIAAFERNNEPFIIRGFDFANKKFDLNIVREIVGDKKTRIRRIKNQEFLDDNFHSLEAGVTSVQRALDIIKRFSEQESEKSLHLSGFNMLDQKEQLESFIKRPACLLPKKLKSIVWFLSYKTRSPAHYHPCVEAMLMQLIGSKEIIMIPPHENKKLHMYPFKTGFFTRSKINFFHAGADKYLQDVEHQKVFLSPGDALFIPMHWVHIPSSQGLSLSNTYFWESSLSSYKLRKESLYSLFVKFIFRPLKGDLA